jgi:two-component system OmpR family response regulator
MTSPAAVLSTDLRPVEPARLLVVDDEPDIRELLCAALRFAGFEVATAGDGQEALAMVQSYRPSLLLLDVMMPGLDGLGVLQRIREQRIETPVIFLTARDATEDRIAGLRLGGDDYVSKPFSLAEVIERIQAVLRRTTGAARDSDEHLVFADVEMDVAAHELRKAGRDVSLPPTAFNLLRYFLENPNRVLSKHQILDHVWHGEFEGDPNVIESYVCLIRRAIDSAEPHLLQTVRGVGYVLRQPRG